MRLVFLTLLIAGTAAPLAAESRKWTSSDGSGSFSGEYVSHDEKRVTIRRDDGKVFELEFSKLHADDKAWVTSRPSPSAPKDEPLPDPKAVFDTLCFGDGIETVKRKLKASKAVETTLDDT